MAYITHCSATDWSVSAILAHNDPSPNVTLHVTRRPVGPKFRHGDHDGRKFRTTDEAFAFAVERGYSVPYFNVKASVFKKVYRRGLKCLQMLVYYEIKHAQSKGDVIEVADKMKEIVRKSSGDVLFGTSWSIGVYRLASRLRPDLIK